MFKNQVKSLTEAETYSGTRTVPVIYLTIQCHKLHYCTRHNRAVLHSTVQYTTFHHFSSMYSAVEYIAAQ